MKSKHTKFNFSNEITKYVGTLGRLSPNQDDHHPEKGEKVKIGIDFLGVPINEGVVVRELADSDQMVAIREKLSDGDELDDADIEYIKENSDFMGSYPELELDMDPTDDTSVFIVKFSEKVSHDFVRGKVGSLSDLGSGIDLTSGKIKAKLVATKEGGYLLTGRLRGFIDGRSVISTRAMDAFKKKHAKKTKVENVAWSDRVLPEELLGDLNDSLDEFCQREPADYHPGSGTVVRDIVHPSMYCYVQGVSKVNGVPGNPSGDKIKGSDDPIDFWGRQYERSIYQWLPAEFLVSADDSVRIDSYINNLDSQKYPGIYSILERMFERTLPMFEAVCSSLRNDFCGVDGRDEDNSPKSISLRNRSLQVITKIVEYRVNREANFDGVWHVEGMSHEQILATALCIVKRDENFSGAEIEFRRFLFAEEGDKLMSSTRQDAIHPTDTLGGGDLRPLGCMKTPANRVIVFPNSHIHRLSSMYSSDGMDATRRIVVFWLVNPERPILSTANVPMQQGVISLDDALRNRLALMAERKLHKENYEERDVGLCEH